MSRPLLTEPEYILADITNRTQMHRIFAEVKPDIVFHAAAYKQLPLLERSPENAIKTNIMGTEIIAEACVLNRVGYLINISTDKAARPTSILGMTKRLAEMIVASYATNATKVASVRFGNVLESRGSFVETLRYQIANDLPITITDARMNRFFMLIPEAAGLVIEASTLANNGSTYVLDMGEPIKIVDIVKRYAEMMRVKSPKIVFTGARPGEKISEELYDPHESYRVTPHPRIVEVDVSSGHVPKAGLNHLYHIITQEQTPAILRATLEQLILTQQDDDGESPRETIEAVPG